MKDAVSYEHWNVDGEWMYNRVCATLTQCRAVVQC